MSNRIIRMSVFAAILAALAFSSGCAAFRASTHNVDVEQERHLKSTYDYSDMRNITDDMIAQILNSRFLSAHAEPPILMIAGVQNRTSRYVDTKALTDRVRPGLFQANACQFVNEARREDLLKEQGYQAAHATPETQAAIGRQLGAKYMLSGSLMEMEETSPRQVRVSKQQVNYYKLTMEITDLETGLLAWTAEKEFARQASQPLIGW